MSKDPMTDAFTNAIAASIYDEGLALAKKLSHEMGPPNVSKIMALIISYSLATAFMGMSESEAQDFAKNLIHEFQPSAKETADNLEEEEENLND